MEVRNPILRGFNPDPSLICVGHDFYIATSTFEWFPGVQIYHSTDLASWKLIARPLDRVSLLDLNGVPPSGGVWAPDLSFCDGRFYLVYTVVRNFGKPFYDVHNYLVTSESIEGPWTEPIALNSSGFDPSIFHDSNRMWLVNMICNYRTWKPRFDGIAIQEYSENEKRLIGEPKIIFQGTPAGTTEGPHIYKKDGYFYLLCAEGGTSYRHQEIVARCKTLDGVYELSPFNPLVSSYPYPENPLQKAGHASIACGPNGKWYLAHLCSRPGGKEKRCILGRETALQELLWDNGWPRLSHGTSEPLAHWNVPEDLISTTKDSGGKTFWKDDFDQNTIDYRFQSLRSPIGSKASLTDRKGWLRLYGRESLGSCFDQSLLACRQQHFCVCAETKIDFSPKKFQQTAGLVYYYDTAGFYYAYITFDEQKGRVISLMCSKGKIFSQPIGCGISIGDVDAITLRLEINYEKARFFYLSNTTRNFEPLGPELDAAVLSDDFYEQNGFGNRFTGAFIGICCQDVFEGKCFADFDYFQYEEK